MEEKVSVRERERERDEGDLGSAAGIVDGAGDEDPSGAIYHQRPVVVRHGGRGAEVRAATEKA